MALLSHSMTDEKEQKGILKRGLQDVKDLFHVSLTVEELREA